MQINTNKETGIANIVAVASGKGGVGKSTTAVNLAVAMAQTGARVGLFDADIYGPSIPRMMGLNGIRPEVGPENTLIPLEKFGVKTMSIGYMADEKRAIVWHGQLVGNAITQMLDDVVWGGLDYLFVDMPPGTGDAQLALTQAVRVTAAVMVTTPQDIALIDCRKGINMFKEVNVRTLGIVENMSQFICPHCGGASAIFKEGGAERLGQEFNTDVLAHIPLDINICQLSDSGTPITAALPDSDQANAYRSLAGEVARKLSIIHHRKVNIPVVAAIEPIRG